MGRVFALRNVRIFYKKLGSMKFVSHLDMNRFMSRLIAKAKIPVWYTEGFHKHLYMNFACPLSLGFEGHYEIMDIRLIDENYSLENCLQALKNACPTDIEFVSVTEEGEHMKNIGFAKYELEFESFSQEMSDTLNDFLSRDEILCEKKGKKGKIKEIDLIPKIHSYEITEKGVNLILVAGSEDNLNPTLVMDTFFTFCGIVPIYYTVKRTMIYNKEFEIFK